MVRAATAIKSLFFPFFINSPSLLTSLNQTFLRCPISLTLFMHAFSSHDWTFFRIRMFSSKAVQYMPHGCIVRFEVVYQGKNNSEVEISLCKHYWHRAWSFNFGIGIFEVSPKCLFLTNAGQRVSQILNLILLSVEILSLKQVLTL